MCKQLASDLFELVFFYDSIYPKDCIRNSVMPQYSANVCIKEQVAQYVGQFSVLSSKCSELIKSFVILLFEWSINPATIYMTYFGGGAG